jgi:diadenosine tetraphosphate (Ap4A) HIT family hydrolase
MTSASDPRYAETCAFCTIGATYPPSTNTPIPSDPNPELLSPQCHLILSTPYVLAFLDIMPMAHGHILLTTRQHYTKLSDLREPPPSTPPNQLWQPRRPPSDAEESARALGQWLPVVSRALCAVTGVEDWNVVQNNGHRAAQVVPHIHFHLIPRYQEDRRRPVKGQGKGGDVEQLKSWKMFGRGTREDLDDDEVKVLAGQLREAIRLEVERSDKAKL